MPTLLVCFIINIFCDINTNILDFPFFYLSLILSRIQNNLKFGWKKVAKIALFTSEFNLKNGINLFSEELIEDVIIVE